MAQRCDTDVGDFVVWTGGDAHLYSNTHGAERTCELSREPRALCRSYWSWRKPDSLLTTGSMISKLKAMIRTPVLKRRDSYLALTILPATTSLRVVFTLSSQSSARIPEILQRAARHGLFSVTRQQSVFGAFVDTFRPPYCRRRKTATGLYAH